MSELPRTYKGLTVPYITAWSAELDASPAAEPLILRTGLDGGRACLRYADESPADRDRYGLLWHRVTWAPGQGRPLFAEVHTARHRHAMLHARCQVCAQPAEVWMTSLLLWRLHLADYRPSDPYQTFDPPVCRACAQHAAAQCPHMAQHGCVFLTPRAWANTAVRGQLADPATGTFSALRTVPLPGAIPAPDPAHLRLVLAKGLLSTLFEPTATRDLHAAHLGERLDPPRPRIPQPRSSR